MTILFCFICLFFLEGGMGVYSIKYNIIVELSFFVKQYFGIFF